MYFSSMLFLWVFLPITLSIYILAKQFGSIGLKNMVLIAASLVFYAWGEPVYILLLLLSVFINYVFGRLLANDSCHKKQILTAAIVCNLGGLGLFKYYDFFVNCGNYILGANKIPFLELALPLGISFYTFQAMSYVIDVYRGEAEVQKNFFHLLLYVSLFPQLVAGPIVKYKDIQTQILNREESYEKCVYGIKRFVYGLGKKVLLSNVFGKYVDAFLGLPTEQIGTSLMWTIMLLYALQIYYDFSGYSDMAIGLGAMFGFDFRENFNYPYMAQSIREFWKRWHISLSTWFKEYVYIPLGGNRKSQSRTLLNLFIVFFLTGFWHGAGFNYILWGLFYGGFMILERVGFGKVLDKNPVKILNHVYVWIVVLCGWVFFRVESVRAGCKILKVMFCYQKGKYVLQSGLNAELLTALIVAILFFGILQSNFPKLKMVLFRKDKLSFVEWISLLVIFLLCVISLSADSYNPFIYFRF